MKKFYLYLSFLYLPLLLSETLETFLGPYEVTHPLLLSLLESKSVQRLKKIDQSGIIRYFNRVPPFSRYDHSIGLMALIALKGGSIEEQAAALMHDASHTVFSHVADRLFPSENVYVSYQDLIHTSHLESMGVRPLIEKYSLTLQDLSEEGPFFSAIKSPHPQLSGDRIEYNLHTAYIYNFLSKEEILDLVRHIHYEEGNWYCDDIASAKALGDLSLYFTDHLWEAPWNAAIYEWTVQMLTHALEKQILSIDDFHFGFDEEVLTQLYDSQDPFILSLLKKCEKAEDYFEAVESKEYFTFFPRFRGLNPTVKIGDSFFNLTELDPEYAASFAQMKSYVAKGIRLKFRN